MVRTPWSRVSCLGVLLVLVGGLGMGLGGPARAQGTSEAFHGVANAEGARSHYELPEFLVVEELVDVGAPAAQALVSDLDSVGYAAAPHPGQTALAAPGLVSGAVGQPVPDYPAYARSSTTGQPEASVDQPPVSLRAESTPDASSARATVGAAPDGPAAVAATLATADVAHDPDDGTTVSVAESIVEGVTISDVLRFGRVRSSARVTAPPGRDRVVESSFEVEGVTVAGVGVGVTDQGLVLAGTGTPLPDGGPIAEVLRQASIDVQYLAPQALEDGIVSAGLQITLLGVTVPGAPTPGDVIIQLGRASARATGGIEVIGDVVGGVQSDPIGAEVVPPAVTGALAEGADGSLVPTSPAESTGEVRQPAVSDAPPTALSAVVPPAIGWSFYPVLVLAGLVVVGASQLIRYFGVRSTWIA